MTIRHRFTGQILGVGSSSGIRVVVGRWTDSPFGSFADAMIERPDGHRVLLAPSARVRDFVTATYTFDEHRVEPFAVRVDRGGWRVTSPSLRLLAGTGRRTPLGRLLRLVPRPLARSPILARLLNPLTRLLPGSVRTAGSAGGGRREYYGATDLRAVTSLDGTFDGEPLGSLQPVTPPCRFGFSSSPRRPSVTTVVSTVDLPGP